MSGEEKKQFSLFERFALMSFHPKKIVFDSVGLVWAFYFLYVGIWQAAIVVFFIFMVFGFFVVRNFDYKAMADTIWGRVAIFHVQPLNLVFKALGMIVLVNGIWRHSIENILIGVTLIFFGHLFGWPRVHPVFGKMKK